MDEPWRCAKNSCVLAATTWPQPCKALLLLLSTVATLCQCALYDLTVMTPATAHFKTKLTSGVSQPACPFAKHNPFTLSTSDCKKMCGYSLKGSAQSKIIFSVLANHSFTIPNSPPLTWEGAWYKHAKRKYSWWCRLVISTPTCCDVIAFEVIHRQKWTTLCS